MKKELIVEVLKDLTNDELLSVYREYLAKTNMQDDEIYSIDELDSILEGQDTFWLLCRAYYGDFNPNAEYFKFNGNGNLQSIFSYQLLEHIDCEEIAEFCIDNDNALYCEDIKNILNEDNEN